MTSPTGHAVQWDPAVQWQGDWISSGEDGPVAPLLRRSFVVPSGAVRGVVHVAGLGLHRTTLDGRPVSDARLESAITDYDRRIIFSSYPVDLSAGSSVIGVELGRGFYAMTTPNVWGWHRAPWRGLRMARVQLEMYDAQGTLLKVVVSDESWRWSPGGTRFDSLYEGETFDARLEPSGWDTTGFDDRAWSPVQKATPPAGELAPQLHEPVRVTDSQAPVRWSGGGSAPLVADFGRQLAGWVQVTAPSVPAGTMITLRFGERADPSGVLLENPHVHSERLDVHEFVVAEDVRTWEPRFTLTGFRYVEVIGIDRPDQVELMAQHAHNDVAVASSFTCSDEVLTWIDSAMRSTVQNNLLHLPTDTPVYEKNGWTGDVHVALEAMLHQFDLRLLLVKWLDDIADSQTADGQLAVIAPTPGWGYLEAPEWTTLYPYLLELLDTWYGIRAVVEKHLPSMLRFVDRELSLLDEDGLTRGILGDYLSPGSDGTPRADDLRLAASCYLVRGLRCAADLVERASTGSADTVQRLRRSADEMATAINAAFLDGEQGCYRSLAEPAYRQTSNILPLAFGITPAEHVAPVAQRLADEIRARGSRHDAGCLGLSELFGVLTRTGHADLAVEVATGRVAPSWGAWMDAGETTMLEMWGPEERSHDHFFMGSMSRWLYQSVAGVRLLAPEWREFAVDPAARAGLEHASCWFSGPQGTLGASWRQTGDVFELTTLVPPGTRAQIHLPGREPFWVGPGEHEHRVDLPAH